jgi:hypothetical protein
MTNNKQSQTTATPEEKPTPELLLRRFKLIKEFIDKVRKANLDAGLDPKLANSYIYYPEPFEKQRYDKWLASVTNPKRPGTFWQISDLKNRDDVPEDYISEYEGKTYPYRTVSQIIKIKNKDGKFLQRIEQWVGLTKLGEEKTVPVVDLDYWVKPPIQYQIIPKDPTNKEGPSIRVGYLPPQTFSVEQPGATRVYITPYSKEKVDECLRYAAGPINNRSGDGTSLVLKKAGTNPVSATYEQFTSEEDFDTLFETIRTPAPEFKDFLNEMKKQAKKAVDADQYQ